MNSYAERFICNAPETDEAKARFRRLKLFMHLTGLVEVVNRPTFVDKIPSNLHNDVPTGQIRFTTSAYANPMMPARWCLR